MFPASCELHFLCGKLASFFHIAIAVQKRKLACRTCYYYEEILPLKCKKYYLNSLALNSINRLGFEAEM
jgi:hypothetical protein